MGYVTVRDLRLRPGEVWEKLREQKQLVLTSNGRPVAIIAEVGDDDVEATLAALRRARAQAAVSRMRATAQEQGLDDLAAQDIDAEIAAVRASRRDQDVG
jgi:antitoxin (DNA-binding transcriptional repressor) of toxin-antitoxin stability system